ncbi:MAG: response regulator transcription factor [Gammaproteobacteria bacterium]|nr:response regulator transcription factor [Gammaproteobacteria bacterium]
MNADTDNRGIILIVDDDPTLLELHAIFLENAGYETITAETGQQALALFDTHQDKISNILSDVLMPDMDGYDLCKKIKSTEKGKVIPFIFVSALSSLDEQLKGYEVGGDDYITKPIQPEIIYKKLSVLVNITKSNQDLKSELQESFKTTMQAMTYSSDLGQILEFYKTSLSSPNYKELATNLFRVTDSYALSCTLQIHTPDKIINIGDKGEISPLESNVIELARKKGRFFDFGARTVINYDDFTLLVKNMPLDNKERYGELKDSLGSLCNAIESRLQVLLYDSKSKQKEEILATVQKAIDNVEELFQEIQKESTAAIENMKKELDEALMRLSLLEYQEENILSIAQKCLDNTNGILDKGNHLSDKLKEIYHRLGTLFSGAKVS